MRIKTEAVVLRNFRLKDSDLVVNFYTQALGRVDAVAHGVFSARSRKNHTHYHLVALLEIEISYKENRDLQNVSESAVIYLYRTLTVEPVKILYATLIAEILHKSVKETAPNPPLFAFIKQTLLSLDQTQGGLYNLLLYFIVHLTRPLGFFPQIEVTDAAEPIAFDFAEGRIFNAPDGGDWQRIIYRFATANGQSFWEIPVPRPFRKPLLHHLFKYYHQHLDDFYTLQSLSVFEEVFRT